MEQPPSAEAPPPIRELTDARSMRALSHPVRLAVIQALSVHGPMTATEVGRRIGETSTTCSFHLRQLAQYGFVEEAGGGKGRARPWKMKPEGMRFSSTNPDPSVAIAARGLAALVREQALARLQQWLATSSDFPEEWQNAATDSDFVLFMTAAETDALVAELVTLLSSRYADRRENPAARPPGTLPVELLLFGYPVARDDQEDR